MSFLTTARSALVAARAVVRSSAPPATPTAPAVARRLAGGARAGLQVMPELPLWQQLARLGANTTPATVSAAIRDADTGRMVALMDLANELRQKDCHLQTVLATSEEAIAGLDWELVLPDDAKLKERKAAEWVEDQLRRCPSFTRAVAHAAGAAFYGYAVSEIVWQKAGDRLAPAEFVPHAPRRFVFAPDNGRLLWCDLNSGMAYPGVDFRALYPGQFLVSQPRINGDIPCREGLVRPLVWAALFRNWSLADWLKLGEIAWKPWRTATYAKSNDDEREVDDLIAVLEAMTSSGVAAVPDTVKLNIEWPKNSASGTSMHHELWSAIAAEQSKCVLGQTLTTEQGRVGSQALGNVHNEVRKDLRESRSRFVADDASRDVVAVTTALNFGAGVRPARFRFLTDDATDLASFADAVKKLREAGTRIPAVWVRDQAGIPEPEEGEELLGDGNQEETTPQDPSQEPPPPEADPGAANVGAEAA